MEKWKIELNIIFLNAEMMALGYSKKDQKTMEKLKKALKIKEEEETN